MLDSVRPQNLMHSYEGFGEQHSTGCHVLLTKMLHCRYAAQMNVSAKVMYSCRDCQGTVGIPALSQYYPMYPLDPYHRLSRLALRGVATGTVLISKRMSVRVVCMLQMPSRQSKLAVRLAMLGNTTWVQVMVQAVRVKPGMLDLGVRVAEEGVSTEEAKGCEPGLSRHYEVGLSTAAEKVSTSQLLAKRVVLVAPNPALKVRVPQQPVLRIWCRGSVSWMYSCPDTEVKVKLLLHDAMVVMYGEQSVPVNEAEPLASVMGKTTLTLNGSLLIIVGAPVLTVLITISSSYTINPSAPPQLNSIVQLLPTCPTTPHDSPTPLLTSPALQATTCIGTLAGVTNTTMILFLASFNSNGYIVSTQVFYCGLNVILSYAVTFYTLHARAWPPWFCSTLQPIICPGAEAQAQVRSSWRGQLLPRVAGSSGWARVMVLVELAVRGHHSTHTGYRFVYRQLKGLAHGITVLIVAVVEAEKMLTWAHAKVVEGEGSAAYIEVLPMLMVRLSVQGTMVATSIRCPQMCVGVLTQSGLLGAQAVVGTQGRVIALLTPLRGSITDDPLIRYTLAIVSLCRIKATVTWGMIVCRVACTGIRMLNGCVKKGSW